MPTAEELKARFENRVRPGPTDERLAASLGLLAAAEPAPQPAEDPPSGSRNVEPAKPTGAAPKPRSRRQPVRLVTPADSEPAGGINGADASPSPAQPAAETDGGGGDLDAVADLFPPPPLLAAAGPEPVKVGFPVPVDLIRDVTRLKVDLSRRLGRRLSNHEIAAAAAGLLPRDPGGAAELVRAHAERIGVSDHTVLRRRLVASIPAGSATSLEDLVLAIDETEGVRVTKSQLWALAHVLLLERAGR